MTDTALERNRLQAAGLGRYLRAGLIAGAAAAVLNIILYFVIIRIGGHQGDVLTVVSISVASLLPNLIAALAYFGLARITRWARPLLSLGVVVFVLVSVLPHLGIGPPPSPALDALPEGFDLVTIPLHIVFGLTAIFVMPWWVARDS